MDRGMMERSRVSRSEDGGRMAVRKRDGKSEKAQARYESFDKKNSQWHRRIERSVKQIDRAAKRASRKRAAS